MKLIRTASCMLSVLLLLSACETTKVAAPVATAAPGGAAALEGAVIGSDGLMP